MGTHTEEGWRGYGRWYDTKIKRLFGFGIGACRLLTRRSKEKGMASLSLAIEDGYIRFGHGQIGFMVRKGIVEYVTLEGHYEELTQRPECGQHYRIDWSKRVRIC